SSYSGSVFRTLSVIFPHLAIAPGDRHLYCASPTPGQVSEEPRTLVQRYLDTPLDQHRFPAQSFYSLLPADRIAFVREQLASEHGEINSDSVPVTYFLNMVLWGKFSASGFVVWMDTLRHMGLWPYLVPLTLFVLLMLLRTSLEGDSRPIRYRQSATFTLFILGLIAMAAQLALLFSYQSHVGFVFSRIALLNGLFMTGLALGAGGIGHRLTLGSRPGINLILVMVLVAAALGALPMLLPALARLDPTHQEGVYLLLSTLAGLLTGMGFPLGVRLAHPDGNDVLRTSGIIEAADHLGGALGGLLTGALLVPTLGIPMTFYLLAAVAVITLFPLLHAEYSPTNIPALRERGHRSFPLPTLSWGIAWGVLTLFIVVLLARGTAPGAIVHFNNATLAEVSSSKSFELRNQPMPHYLGTGAVVGGETATEPGGTTPAAAAQRYHPDATVSLATATVASNVRGYAGPINLLVAVDRQGILRGARYIQSVETPSYIENIDQWLNGLAGLDLSSVPLSLDGVDALSGATVTSQAALESINRAVSAGGDAAFQLSFAPTSASGSSKIITVKFIITALLLLLFFPIYHSGGNAVRLIYQGAVLVILGFWFNTLVTEIDLVNISVGHLPSWSSNPQRYLLLGFTLIITLLYGQAYCGYVCPFGAMQEFISRIGRFFRLRSYIIKKLDTRARYLKFLILALMLSLFWATDEPLWASFNPMQHLFAIDFSGWMVPIVLFSLAGALFYYRFWCRYFCPFGAFLALFNKVALAKAITPARDFKRCDLGVREEYDVDCIHCHRCISGKDCGQRTRENK
ncbi:MAG: 4Fe-4S binding protein, partial [Gammaproteobacteria bacterium]|nr:4Fe-4S binding protein [Gammaproteobacteria bacterium]